MNALPPEVMKNIFTYVGKGSFCFIGPVSKDFCYNYLTMDIIEDRNAHKLDLVLAVDRNKVTTADAASSSTELAEHCFLNAPDWFQKKLFRIAARKGSQDIVTMAMQISGVDINGWINGEDVEEITKRGDLGMLLLLKEKGLNFSSWLYRVIKNAALHGHLNILRCLHQMKENISSEYDILFGAAKGGHLNIIKWGINAGYLFEKSSLINAAVRSGNLELVKWFRNQDTPWNDSSFIAAVDSGNTELLQYILDNGCVFESNGYRSAYEYVWRVDEKGKQLEIFKWLHQNNFLWNEETCSSAARNGNLDALIYARNNGWPWDGHTIEAAVRYANFEMVKYCLENDSPIGEADLCRYSMIGSNHEKALKVLKLLREFNLPWDESTCATAARYGNLEALKWARNEGCPWDEYTFEGAIESNDFATVQYCIDNGCPFGQDLYPVAVTCKDPIPMLKLLHFNGYEWDERACSEAASQGDLKLLRWLRYHDCPWNDEEVCNEAVIFNHYDILVFAHENGCPLTKETYACCFHEFGLEGGFNEVPTEYQCSDEVMEYIRKHNCPQPEPSDWRVHLLEYDSDSEDEVL